MTRRRAAGHAARTAPQCVRPRWFPDTNPFLISRAEIIAAFAARYCLPAIYGRRNFAAAGGLASYGDNVAEGYRQDGLYAGRILKGVKPAELPVVQVSKWT
jgi:putative tryptophan/tyrosine transport system substrate-binding protein